MEDMPWVRREWHTSPFNGTALAESGLSVPDQVSLIDCTLREGEQTPGVVMWPEEKLQLARELDECGFPELEIGMPAVSEQEARNVKGICGLGLRAKTIAVVRALKEDVDLALDCGVDGVSVSLPVGYLQLQHKLKWNEERVMARAVEISRYAHEQGLHVTMSPFDTTRVRLPFFMEYLHQIYRHGHMDRVRVVDTVGCATPAAIDYLVRQIRRTVPVPVEVHCHNDFGLAVANTIAGVLAGATAVSTTINGIGERTGNAATEEVALALEVLYGVRTHLKLDRFVSLSEFVQKATGFPVQKHKAVVGANAFAQEAGLVVSGYVNEPFTAQAYLPELVGQRPRVLLGKKSGTESIRLKLRELDLQISDREVAALLQRVKELAEEQKGPVTDEQFAALAQKVRHLGADGGR